MIERPHLSLMEHLGEVPDPRMLRTQLKQETTKKLGIEGKRRRAGWDPAYMEIVLRGTVSI